MAKNVFIPLLWPLFLSPNLLALDNCRGHVDISVPSVHDAIEGTNATLNCLYDTARACIFTLVWWRGDSIDDGYIGHYQVGQVNVHNTTKYDMFMHYGVGSSLVVKNIEMTDNNKYGCQLTLTNDANKNVAYGNLTVAETDCSRPVNVIVWPEEAVEGASAIMRCSYIIDKDCFFLLVWRRGDGNDDKSYIALYQVNDGNVTVRNKAKYDMTIDICEGSNLTVKNVSEKDSGEYRCELKMHDTESNKGSANLTVLGASTTIIPTTTTTTEGGLSGGAIAGIAIGAIAVLAIVILAICKFCR